MHFLVHSWCLTKIFVFFSFILDILTCKWRHVGRMPKTMLGIWAKCSQSFGCIWTIRRKNCLDKYFVCRHKIKLFHCISVLSSLSKYESKQKNDVDYDIYFYIYRCTNSGCVFCLESGIGVSSSNFTQGRCIFAQVALKGLVVLWV